MLPRRGTRIGVVQELFILFRLLSRLEVESNSKSYHILIVVYLRLSRMKNARTC